MTIINNEKENLPYLNVEEEKVDEIPWLTKEQLNEEVSIYWGETWWAWWVWNNWAFMFVTSNWNATATTTILPLDWWFDWWWVITADTTNYKMVVSESWLYFIQALWSFWITNSARLYTRLRKNWTLWMFAQYYRLPSTTTESYHEINISWFYYLEEWDDVTFVWYADWNFDRTQRDINSDWTTWGWENEMWASLQMYKL